MEFEELKSIALFMDSFVFNSMITVSSGEVPP